MRKGNKVLLIVAVFLFSLIISSAVQADLSPYYSMYGMPMYTAGSMFGNANMYMTARAMGAYATTDYSSAWGLNNLAQMGQNLGITAGGMGLGALNLMNNWTQSYPMAPMYGYSSALNPWMGYSSYPLGYSSSNYSFPMQSYYPSNLYNQYNYNTVIDSPYYNSSGMDFSSWGTNEDEEE